MNNAGERCQHCAVMTEVSKGVWHNRKSLPSLFFFYQPSSVRGWISAFLLAVHRLCGVIERRLSYFLPCWLRTGWQSIVSQGKFPWNTLPWLGIELGPRGGQTVSYPTELFWLIQVYLLGLKVGWRGKFFLAYQNQCVTYLNRIKVHTEQGM